VRLLDGDPTVSFVSCWLRAFGDEEWEWKPERCDLPELLWEDTVLTASLVRREAVEAVGGYDMEMPIQGAEDWDLWLTLVARGYRGAILREVLFNYRRREGSLSTIAWNGSGHLPLTAYRVAKHRDTYRAHLIDVFLHQDEETGELLRQNDEIERYIATRLEPAVMSHHEELASLRSRLASATSTVDGHAVNSGMAQRIDELEAALRAASAEAIALRTSRSWRITGPLREVFGWWLRWRGSA